MQSLLIFRKKPMENLIFGIYEISRLTTKATDFKHLEV